MLDFFSRDPMLYFILPNIIFIPLEIPVTCIHKNIIPNLRYKVKLFWAGEAGGEERQKTQSALRRNENNVRIAARDVIDEISAPY